MSQNTIIDTNPVSQDHQLPARSLYNSILFAFEFFNRKLFENRLPGVILTLSRKHNTAGYFVTNSYHSTKLNITKDDAYTPEILQTYLKHELALNPEYFSRTTEKTYSTLVHEQVHLYQHIEGTASRSGYHNADWANKMEAVGLLPTSTGKPGGKRIGQTMTHLIIPGGAYQNAYNELMENQEYQLQWAAIPYDSENTELIKSLKGHISDPEISPTDKEADTKTPAEKKRASKTKYRCEICDVNAWAKPKVNLVCGDCGTELQPN